MPSGNCVNIFEELWMKTIEPTLSYFTMNFLDLVGKLDSNPKLDKNQRLDSGYDMTSRDGDDMFDISMSGILVVASPKFTAPWWVF